MTEESPDKRGDAAWKEQREAISRRNARGAQARAWPTSRPTQALQRAHRRASRWTARREQLRTLNARISKQQARGVR